MRHQVLDDVIARAFVFADMPVTKEPDGFLIANHKRPDGLNLLPWQEGKPLASDVTVICPLAVSYVSGYTPSAAAELAALRKCEKYANLPKSYIFQRSKIWALSTRQPLLSFLHLSARKAPSLMIFGYPPSCFSALLSCCSVLTLFFCERVLCVIRTSNLFSCF